MTKMCWLIMTGVKASIASLFMWFLGQENEMQSDSNCQQQHTINNTYID